jgi:hypothetical protein
VRSEAPDIPVARLSHASRLVKPDFLARIGDLVFATARRALGWVMRRRLRLLFYLGALRCLWWPITCWLGFAFSGGRNLGLRGARVPVETCRRFGKKGQMDSDLGTLQKSETRR